MSETTETKPRQPEQAIACLTVRDYFAAQAMQALINHPWYKNDNRTYMEIAPNISTDAYVIADAMLKARAME